MLTCAAGVLHKNTNILKWFRIQTYNYTILLLIWFVDCIVNICVRKTVVFGYSLSITIKH